MFAQARFYDTVSGRFQSEDRVKGFKNAPYTLNHYGYCFGNPVNLVDNDGNWPSWNDVKEGAKNWYKENEDTIKTVATVATTAAVVAGAAAVTVATGGAAAVVIGGAVAGAGLEVAAEAVDNKLSGKDVFDVSNYNLTDICIAAGAGAITAGIGSSLGAAVKSGEMLKSTAKVLDKVGTTVVSMGNNMLSNYLDDPNISTTELVTEGLVAGGISLGLQFLAGKVVKNDTVKKGADYLRRANNYGYRLARYYDVSAFENFMGVSITATTYGVYQSMRAGYNVLSTWGENALNSLVDDNDDGIIKEIEGLCGQ